MSKYIYKSHNVTGRVRIRLVEYFKGQGKYLDKAWFSKLSASENKNSNQLIIKAPTNFIRDYVTHEFKHVIESCCMMEHYQLKEVI